jgi:hypothetical protein
MSLNCSRCGTDVPREAIYCPYCSLQKPKNGFAPAAPSEQSKLTEPKSQSAFNKGRKGSPSRALKKQRTTSGRSFRVPVIAAIVALISIGIYIFVVPMISSYQAEPKVILSALETLRRMPSNEPGLTIDARLTKDLETSRRVKNLVSSKGWTVQSIKGTKTKVLMVYSYQEVGDVTIRAEWLADLATNTFIPQNDTATAVTGG